MSNKFNAIRDLLEYVIIEQGRKDTPDSPDDWAICMNRDAGFGGFEASAEGYRETLLDAIKEGKALSDLHGIPLVLANCATDALIKALAPEPQADRSLVIAPPAPVVTGTMVIGQMRGTLRPGHSLDNMLAAIGDVLDSPAIINLSEVSTRWIREPAKEIRLYAGCPYANDGEPYQLVGYPGTTDGKPLSDADMDVLSAHASCIGVEVHYPNGSKYGVPEEVSVEGALQMIANARLSVAALGVHLHDNFCVDSNDRGDDSAMQVWFRLQIPAALCLADGSPV